MGRSPVSEEIPPPERTRSPSTIGEQLRISEISSPALSCQADNCSANLSSAKRYYRRHKVCEIHSKSASVIVSGLLQRFCQQCSRFHETCEFDEAKRSCRKRLAGHNERRRKICPELDADGDAEQESKLCRRTKISFSQTSTCNGFQIR